MIEGIGSTVRYMGEIWINAMHSVPPVWGVNKDSQSESATTENTEDKKSFQQLLEETKKERKNG